MQSMQRDDRGLNI